MLDPIRSEYHRYRRLVELAVEQIDDDDLSRPLGPGENSIAVLMTHLSGNLRSRFTDFLTSDGEKPWRDRDREFAPHERADRARLLSDWNDAWAVVDCALDDCRALGPVITDRSVTIRGQPLPIPHAWTRSLAHVATHAGQIVMLARHFVGPSWRSLSIPPGGSAAYAANPTREIGPDGTPDR